MGFSEVTEKTPETREIKRPELKGYKDIKSEGTMSKDEVKSFWGDIFEKVKDHFDSPEKTFATEVKEVLSDYIDDIKNKSDVVDTLSNLSINVKDLKKISPEENAKMHEEYDTNKNNLIRQWEEKHQQSWPVYKKDVYITTKTGEKIKIREAGQKYDAHHIQPLSLGGKNEVDNITPLRAEVHFDHKGVHETESPFDKLSKMIGDEKSGK